MKNNFFIALFLIVHFPVAAQRAVDVKYDQDIKGNFSFTYNNKAFCNYILQVNFSSLQNAVSDHTLPFITEVKPGIGKLFKLSREKATDPIQLKYGFSSFKGCLHPAVDTGFVYLLPIAPGKETQAYEIKNAARVTTDGRPLKNWYAIRLRMKPGDTIYSSRRGVVTDVNVGSGQNDAGISGPEGDNFIEIAHRDCSFGEYGIIKKDGSFVKPGQVVEAGQPIGLVGGDKFGRGSEARFSVTYNELQEAKEMGTGPTVSSIYIPVIFWTKQIGKGLLRHGATYVSEHPKAILTQETAKAAPARPSPRKKK